MAAKSDGSTAVANQIDGWDRQANMLKANKSRIRSAANQAKRLIRMVIGFTVLLVGIAMIVLPGPAIVVIPIGLAILATEFVWAKKLMKRLTDRANTFRKNPPQGPSG